MKQQPEYVLYVDTGKMSPVHAEEKCKKHSAVMAEIFGEGKVLVLGRQGRGANAIKVLNPQKLNRAWDLYCRLIANKCEDSDSDEMHRGWARVAMEATEVFERVESEANGEACAEVEEIREAQG